MSFFEKLKAGLAKTKAGILGQVDSILKAFVKIDEDLFEELLDEKGIEIPCEDSVEQRERYDGGNEAKLYGTEYWNLVDEVNSLIELYNRR